YSELLDGCEAVSFAVPPDVQVKLAIQAARAGKALLLEKPLAFTFEDASTLATAVSEYGVSSLMFLPYRKSGAVTSLLPSQPLVDVFGGTVKFVSSYFTVGPYASSR